MRKIHPVHPFTLHRSTYRTPTRVPPVLITMTYYTRTERTITMTGWRPRSTFPGGSVRRVSPKSFTAHGPATVALRQRGLHDSHTCYLFSHRRSPGKPARRNRTPRPQKEDAPVRAVHTSLQRYARVHCAYRTRVAGDRIFRTR
jgi:hypothetical protein